MSTALDSLRFSIVTVCVNRWEFLRRSLPTWHAIPNVARIVVATYDFDPVPDWLSGVTLLSIDAPQFHKTRALNAAAKYTLEADQPSHLLFIDSDVLVMTVPQSLPDSLAAVPASFNHHAKPVWQHVYSRFGLTLPLASPPTLVSRDRTAPYFNSGVIVVPGPVAKRLAASWIDTAMQIDGDPQVPDSSKRPNLSQLALPVAAARLGLGIEVVIHDGISPAGHGGLPKR